jgi:sialic acid synthase SpsE
MPGRPDRVVEIKGTKVGLEYPVYFVADIAANHDGNLDRAKDLIYRAAEAGAAAAKFQHFAAETIVSDFGFRNLGSQQSHQASWRKSVFEVYKDASIDVGWTATLAETCDKAGIAFFTSPYSLELVDIIDSHVPAYKIGSGDITWLEIIEYIAAKRKPVLMASGASTTDDVCRAVEAVLKLNSQFCLMQCNTSYTGSLENFKYVHLNVLRTYQKMYPDMILGLSDHTPGHTAVLGAVALGARVVEKHFTDDVTRVGPDHGFSMDPRTWREMVDRTRELELAIGNGVKKVEDNERETVILQRRSLRAVKSLSEGTVLKSEHLIPLRPCPADGIPPYHLRSILGRQLRRTVQAGDHLRWIDLI